MRVTSDHSNLKYIVKLKLKKHNIINYIESLPDNHD